MIYIGTSGFSYTDWRDVFYPKGMKSGEFLAFYADKFPALELNSSYYAVPSPRLIDNLINRTPESFQVVVKAFRGITHEREDTKNGNGGSGSGPEKQLESFLTAVEPLADAGKLAALLFQFPYSFHYGRRETAFLELLLSSAGRFPVVVEFRNSGWMKREVWEILRRHDAAWCCVDEPRLPGLMPPEVVCTSSSLGYVRFHGRNAAKWWNPREAWERYDYLYPTTELEEWVKDIKWLEQKTDKTFIFFNNHRQGQAVQNAREMQELLREIPRNT